MYLAMPEICTRYNAPVLGHNTCTIVTTGLTLQGYRHCGQSLQPGIHDARDQRRTKQRRIVICKLNSLFANGAPPPPDCSAGRADSGIDTNAAPAQAVPSADPSKEIVYVDRNGIIRVLDTQGDPLVQWFSPTGGWRRSTLAM